MIAVNHFQERSSEPYLGNLYGPMTNWNRVNGGWLPDEEKKGSGKFKTIAAVAVAVLASLAVGAAALSDQRK